MTDNLDLLPPALGNFVRENSQIRAAVLNGSRANPHAPRDFLQDWDLAVYLRDFDCIDYRKDPSWIGAFGNLVVCQQNDADDGSYIFLMQFDTGLRIDLDFFPLERLESRLQADSLSVVVYDADGRLASQPVSDDTDYRTSRPDQKVWDATLNELWWLQPSVARELWRGNFPLAHELWDVYLRSALLSLVNWHVGHRHDWQVNTGKAGKWLERFLEPELYAVWLDLYCGPDPGEMQSKLPVLGDFVALLGRPLAEKLGFDYPLDYDRQVRDYLERFKDLPRDAGSFET